MIGTPAELTEDRSRGRANRKKVDDETPDIAIDHGDAAPLLPPGRYEAIAYRAERFRVHGTVKLAVYYRIKLLDSEAEFGSRWVNGVCRYYHIRRAQGGRHSAGKHSDYYREWVLVTGRKPCRADRLSPRVFFEVLCEVEIVTVTHNRHRQPLPAALQYSRVARITSRLAGGARL